jgi:hypothetical protein
LETTTGEQWNLKPGDEIERKELHRRFGGRTQGGIGPSAKTPNVLLFTDPIAGEKHGYYDGWMPDGCFHYTGEGQYGDQRMISGNSSILKHELDGRALRVFQGARGFITYIGEFVIAEQDPWYEADAPESGGGPLRKVIVFRLRPVDTSPLPPETTLARFLINATKQVESLPVEQHITERTFVNPDRAPYEAERKEADLVMAFRDYLRSKGYQVSRQQIMPPGETRPLFTDLYTEELSLLIEGKGSVTRENIRMAIGQLADYNRFLAATKKAILVPSEPRSDLIKLAHSQQCVVIWPALGDFASSDLTFPF